MLVKGAPDDFVVTLITVRVFVLSSMLSGDIYLRLKSYLVVKMSSDLVTEHCCQLYILSMMFVAPTAGCVDIAQSIHLSTTFDFTPAGRQTWNVKNIS